MAHATGLPVLVSGTRLEAAVMSAMLQSDLAATPRWVEGRSRNTRENAQRSAAILSRAGVRRIVLVTSSAHMARSLVEFATAGLAVVPAPTEMARRRERDIVAWEPDAAALLRSRRVLYEILARCVQSVRGRIGRTVRRRPVRTVRPRAVP